MIDHLFPPRAFQARPPADVAALQRHGLQGYCPICGETTLFRVEGDNLREDVTCVRCGSFNRQRQLALVLLEEAGNGARNVAQLPAALRIWSLEASRALHAALRRRLGSGHVASEYVGPEHASGDVVGGVLHVDARRTHFAAGAFDVVLSSDVLEHVPD